ncbi:MAG: hypothetical protein BWK73_36065 [Thiothrix lacustris]|uniref:Uncharacterized protein n=1 Tax=Thiothrix lacustris TaxID=525917 RepID=A0A1Y1QG20_9GAMM|nr:MAG: hypothetical protein BWK73_36065 [Thiothrix lacustris]
MTLGDCLQTMQGYGVALQRNGDGLLIQSVTFKPTDQQKAILKAFKPLLLAILPSGAGQPIGAVMDAVEAYQERQAIMDESNVLPTTVERVALAQARRVLLSG